MVKLHATVAPMIMMEHVEFQMLIMEPVLPLGIVGIESKEGAVE